MSRQRLLNPFNAIKEKVRTGTTTNQFYSLSKLDNRVENLPFSIKILLESAVRNCDNFTIKETDVEHILNWKENNSKGVEIPFKPGRVLHQDSNGLPVIVNLAALRDAVQSMGLNPAEIHPHVPSHLVIDHSIQVDTYGTSHSKEENESIEFRKNFERYKFLKWAQENFDNFQAFPPGSGISHLVNLEHLAQVVCKKDGILFPDSVIGTDSHTTTANSLGIVGWGVGGIEAGSVMLGQHITMELPEVVGFKLKGKLRPGVNATDLGLTIVEILRRENVIGKFVEFFGDGVFNLGQYDRATVANLAPEYGASLGFFAVDETTIDFLKMTGRDESHAEMVKMYLKKQGLFREDYEQVPDFSGRILELDLSEVEASIAGPKRPQDRINLTDAKRDFKESLTNEAGFKGFEISKEEVKKSAKLVYKGEEYTLNQGSLIIASMCSCTNNGHPNLMFAAGLLAKKAVERGLRVSPYIRTSLSPASRVVTEYLEEAGLQDSLNKLGFFTAGYGCMTAIGNSGEFDPEIQKTLEEADLITSAVLSSNRNYEGRIHPMVRASYLSSPALVVAYAIKGTVDVDFETEPIGQDDEGNSVYLRDIWPSDDEVEELVQSILKPEIYLRTYKDIKAGTERWNSMEVPNSPTYEWNENSTYLKKPPFFEKENKLHAGVNPIKDAYCLLNLGDFVTTDHISPGSKIAKNSPAATYLKSRGISYENFNTYGSRRGNFEIMARGTFANIRLVNKLLGKNVTAPETLHIPSGGRKPVFEVANMYIKENQPTIILAGKEYGSGSSRDWAAV